MSDANRLTSVFQLCMLKAVGKICCESVTSSQSECPFFSRHHDLHNGHIPVGCSTCSN